MSTRVTGGNEVVETYGDGTRDYTALATHEGLTDNDNVTDEVSPVLEIYDDASPYTDHLDAVGATNNATYFRIWRAAAGHRHLGDPASGVKFVRTSAGHGFLINSENNSSIQDLVIAIAVDSGATLYTVYAIGTDNRIIGVIAFESANAGAGTALGFEVLATGVYLYNCAAIGCPNDGFEVRASGCRIWHCTSKGNAGRGVDTTGGVQADVRNTIADGNGIEDFDTTSYAAACTNNWSSDGTAPGSNPKSGTLTYEDAANDIYRLASSDTGAKDQGSDISADVDDDVAFNTRPHGSAVDVGFHEFTAAAAGGGMIHKRSFPSPLLGM